MSSTETLAPDRVTVLADFFAGTWIRNVVMVVAGALFTAVLAQISIQVPPSPVPITAQTLAVVLVGASLGSRRGLASIGLYIVLGFFFPVYSDGATGVEHLFGATGGYLFGFLAAAWIVGKFAERSADRRVPTALLSFVLGQAVVFGFGLIGLRLYTSEDWSWVFHNGFAIFIVGGLVKATIGALAMPVAWRLLDSEERRSRTE